jgi:hypothetical protein
MPFSLLMLSSLSLGPSQVHIMFVFVKYLMSPFASGGEIA